MTEPPADDALSLEMITAALRLDSSDAAIYASVLANSLSEALPPGYVTVDRERTMADRMRGRPGEVSKVAVKLGDQVMTLGVKNAQPTAEICREVRGVVLSRQTVPLGQWAAALARALMSHAEANAQAAEALRRLVIGSLRCVNPAPLRGRVIKVL
ncbi:MAG: hypothetical protein ACRDNW_01645 [Trebonia sp.]